MHSMTKEKKDALVQKYVGKRIQLIAMDDMQAPPAGTKGTCIGVDDLGTLHMRWDTGSGLGLCDVDKFILVNEKEEEK